MPDFVFEHAESGTRVVMEVLGTLRSEGLPAVRRLAEVGWLVLLPLAAIMAASYVQVKGELEDQHEVRLRRGAKEAGLAIFDRLELIDNELSVVAGAYASDRESVPTLTVDSSEFAIVRFRWVAVTGPDGYVAPVFGTAARSSRSSP